MTFRDTKGAELTHAELDENFRICKDYQVALPVISILGSSAVPSGKTMLHKITNTSGHTGCEVIHESYITSIKSANATDTITAYGCRVCTNKHQETISVTTNVSLPSNTPWAGNNYSFTITYPTGTLINGYVYPLLRLRYNVVTPAETQPYKFIGLSMKMLQSVQAGLNFSFRYNPGGQGYTPWTSMSGINGDITLAEIYFDNSIFTTIDLELTNWKYSVSTIFRVSTYITN